MLWFILMIVVGLGSIGVSICHFVFMHSHRLIEMNNQIALYGFYKEDLITLINNYEMWRIDLIVAIITILLGFALIVIGISLVCYYW